LKILYPNDVYLIRGNHEFESVCFNGGFQEEMKNYFENPELLQFTYSAFSFIPLAAKVNSTVLCIHGGIGPSVNSVDQILKLERPIINFNQSVCEYLVWSDPDDLISYYNESNRGLGVLFGRFPFGEFISQSNLNLVVRGHECVSNGCEKHFEGKLVTVFSASNYCGVSGNKSAVLYFKEDEHYDVISFPPMPFYDRSRIIQPTSQTTASKRSLKSVRDFVQMPKIIPSAKHGILRPICSQKDFRFAKKLI
jgi:protein phosphatase